ncbi:TPA: SMI1/KNR4 family protein [Pseudomonas aeruginosa]|uniref:SMI1/KNR4 family protein n=1 Tax=Pseudomonas aeruginosa TaxID=287 RepID=UPI000E31D134|nr:SMI1/KNR4 family protein [Pseudomonas aeruginosa]NPX94514.1 SMI1/KNR4 family protein [Pseudomonas aeruginosa]
MTEWRYIKHNISQADIEAFEELASISLPPAMRKFILAHNNGRPRPNRFDTALAQGRLFDKLLSFNRNDLENVFNTHNTLGTQLPAQLVALGLDPFGNYICLDKHSLNVVFWVHETGTHEATGKPWTQWLDALY